MPAQRRAFFRSGDARPRQEVTSWLEQLPISWQQQLQLLLSSQQQLFLFWRLLQQRGLLSTWQLRQAWRLQRLWWTLLALRLQGQLLLAWLQLVQG
ncbi:MAG: hypothetical protein JWP47_493 [Polaromonas sp.]|nr:hypothetical protein [Polaromonas sp.]